MKTLDLIRQLEWLDLQGRYLVSRKQLRTLFPGESSAAFTKAIQRACQEGILESLTPGIYLNPRAHSYDGHLLEWLARLLRSGPRVYTYISLESALSRYGLISQMPVDRLTLMTTGRRGEIKTPYGVVEFTHTRRKGKSLLDSMLPKAKDEVLPLATQQAALRDLQHVGRNTHLLLSEVEG